MSDPLRPASTRATPLRPADQEELADRLASLLASEAPLPAGLRAAAAETSGRLAQTLTEIADRLEAGVPLPTALEGAPPLLVAVLARDATPDTVDESLQNLVEHQRAARALRGEILRAVSYPALVLALLPPLFLLARLYVVEEYEALTRDFQLDLPPTTSALYWFCNHGLPWLGWFALACAVLIGAARALAGPVWFQRALASAPVLGPLWRWLGAADMARLLRLLTRRGVPLPEALRLTAGALRDASLSYECRRLASAVEEGQPLSNCLKERPALPATMIPLARWGERVGALDQAFAAIHEMFEERARQRARLLQTVVPPLAFVSVGGAVAWIVVGLYAPLIELISSISK